MLSKIHVLDPENLRVPMSKKCKPQQNKPTYLGILGGGYGLTLTLFQMQLSTELSGEFNYNLRSFRVSIHL